MVPMFTQNAAVQDFVQQQRTQTPKDYRYMFYTSAFSECTGAPHRARGASLPTLPQALAQAGSSDAPGMGRETRCPAARRLL